MTDNYKILRKGVCLGSEQSFPIGNGDLGANVWTAKDGIFLLLSKTDAFSELHRLLKTGYIKIAFDNYKLDENVEMQVIINNGVIIIKDDIVNIKIWADANNPIYIVEIDSKIKLECSVKIINYRAEDCILQSNDRSNYPFNHNDGQNIGFECKESKDIVFCDSISNKIGQYHHNKTSHYNFSLQHQDIGDFKHKNDPLINRIFGFCVYSENMRAKDNALFSLEGGACKYLIQINSQSGIYASQNEWISKIKNFSKFDYDKHLEFWKSKFDNAYINLKDCEDARLFNQGFNCQRYLNLCAGRGQYPIKFNGSIFTCQTSPHCQKENYDYRNWGGMYWCQNTRLIYWSLLYTGDYHNMLPFFNLYVDNLELAKYRTKKYFNHDGAFFPETISIFGTYADANYGWDRQNLKIGEVTNRYIRWHFNGVVEVAYMMLKYCQNSNDSAYYQHCKPFITEVLLFFKEHFPLVDNKMYIAPTSSLETWQNCINDTPTIAGLASLCKLILNMDNSGKIADISNRILSSLPAMPIKRVCFKKRIAPYQKNIEKKKQNCENPELYPVFPYDMFDIHSDNLKIGINTYKSRKEKKSNGWQQHAIQASRLGLVKYAYKEIKSNFLNTNKKCIFPSFYGPNYDWLPDGDNGNVAVIALTQMLVQYTNKTIFILPAWDKNISVNFRLPINDNYVTVSYRVDGKKEVRLDKPDSRNIIFLGDKFS